MNALKSMHQALTATAAAALMAGALALPAAAQTATTPDDNGAGCSNTSANEPNCVNNNSSSVSQPNAETIGDPDDNEGVTQGGSNANTTNNNTGSTNGNASGAAPGNSTDGGKGGLGGNENTN